MTKESMEKVLISCTRNGKTTIILNNGETLLIDFNIHNFFNLYGIDNFYDASYKKSKNKYLNKVFQKDHGYINAISALLHDSGFINLKKLFMVVYTEDKTSDCYAKLIFLNEEDNSVEIGLYSAGTARNYLTNETICNVGYIKRMDSFEELIKDREVAFPISIISNKVKKSLSKEEINDTISFFQGFLDDNDSRLSYEKPDMLHTSRGVKRVLEK